jgi:hypothetical protein
VFASDNASHWICHSVQKVYWTKVERLAFRQENIPVWYDPRSLRKTFTLAGQKFKWTPGTTTNIQDDWTGKANDVKAGTLEVSKFLNSLQGYDKIPKKDLPQMDLVTLMDKAMRHGQIGGLGSKMENVLGTKNDAPVYEFRDLTPAQGSNLETTMASYEDTVISYHSKAPKRSIDASEDERMW